MSENKTMSRTIHIVCCLGAAASLRQGMAISAKDVLYSYDSLRLGRLDALVDVASWRAMRLAQQKSMERRPRNAKWRKTRKPNSPNGDLLYEFDRLADATSVLLWIGTGIDNQLTLVWLPQFLRVIGVPLEKLWFVQFERSSKGDPSPRSIDDASLATLDEAWSALIAPDPTALVRFVNRPSATLPWLPTALKTQLSQFPDSQSGLNSYEAQLLASTRDRGSAPVNAYFDTLIKFKDAGDSIHDRWLFWRMLRLGDSSLPHPALTLAGGQTILGDTEVHLTEVGEQLLRSEANFIELNGIDEWVGGVHLDSRARNIWVHQDGTLVRA
jgi:hypothetical protein